MIFIFCCFIYNLPRPPLLRPNLQLLFHHRPTLLLPRVRRLEPPLHDLLHPHVRPLPLDERLHQPLQRRHALLQRALLLPQPIQSILARETGPPSHTPPAHPRSRGAVVPHPAARARAVEARTRPTRSAGARPAPARPLWPTILIPQLGLAPSKRRLDRCGLLRQMAPVLRQFVPCGRQLGRPFGALLLEGHAIPSHLKRGIIPPFRPWQAQAAVPRRIRASRPHRSPSVDPRP